MNNRKLLLKNVCDFNRSNISPNNLPDYIYYLDTGNITRNKIDEIKYLQLKDGNYPSRARREVKNNTILYSTVRPKQEHFGIINNPPLNLIVSTGFTTIDVIDNDIDPLYLYYSLTRTEITQYLQTIAESNVSSYPSIIPDDLGNVTLEIPKCKSEQTKITSIISSIDNKINTNKLIFDLLDNLEETIYEYWFVQYDFPNDKGKPYKLSGGNMTYSEDLRKHIPANWEVKPLADWIVEEKGGDWGKQTKQGNYVNEVTCIRGTDIPGLNGKDFLDAPTRFILEKNSFNHLEPFDLIIEISGGSPTQSTGRLAPITKYTLDRFNTALICSNFCKAIKLIDPIYFFVFVQMWNRLYKNNIFIRWEGKTSGIKNLLFDLFVKNIKVEIPPNNVLEKFNEIISHLEGQKQNLLKQSQQLYLYRNWLLPLLMNGQVTVD